MQKPTISELEAKAREGRRLIIRMLTEAGSGHPGGSLSAIDIITTLFFSEMKVDPKNPTWADRDRFVLSKGHGVPALYAALGLKGYFNPEDTMTLRKLGSPFQGHPDRMRMAAVEACTGSLGQGLSIAQGMALGLRLDKKSARVYCLVGDGEIQEGQIWEAAMSIPMHKLTNICVFLDYNKLQIDGKVQEIMYMNPVKKFEAFGWNVLEINGHDIGQILKSLEKARAETTKPTLIVADTVKGKGVSFMEHVNKWHGSSPSREEADKALKELA
ncbi:MAG: transketolase [Bdellovibrionia bacterium]